MAFSDSKINYLVQAGIAVFTIAFLWLAFVYYPKVSGDYQSGKIIPRPTVFKPVVAKGATLPIETESYKIVWEEGSGTYYAFINGKNLEEFVFARDNAKLALKNALSAEKLCPFSIIYVSTERLSVPQKYLDNSDC
ncbi:hypothetical protein HYW40_00520 [Candidatus Curtissbacteria bacterium]|nr:hypothetical protein [Candidatus Curtissbacteria bacterium]